MNSMNITTNWLSTKALTSCLFVINSNDIKDNENNCDSDIESLLESYDNCVKLCPQTNDLSIDCKLYLNTINTTEEDLKTVSIINSFSMLCSAKVVEIHGNGSNEYLNTIFNEFVDEFDGLSMFRSDHRFVEPQKEISITFKNFNELWIYGLVVKLSRVQTQPVMSQTSKDITNLGSIFNMISMFAKTSRSSDSSSDDLIEKLTKLKTEEVIDKSVEQKVLNESNNNQITSDSMSSEDNCLTVSVVPNDHSMVKDLCGCDCHKNHNCIQFHKYIEQKFSDLEKTVNNRFNSLEDKLFSTLSLCLNKS